MSAFITVSSVLLAVLAARGVRWAYVLFVVFGLAYFPLQVGFQLDPRGCQLLFDARLALFSLTNFAHIILFAVFFLISNAHFSGYHWSQRRVLVAAATATVLMGALVELAQGVSGNHNCRARDLIPDAAGVVVAVVLLTAWRRITRRVMRRSPSGTNA